MGSRTIRIDKTAALCGMIWFVFIIDACFTWFFPNIVRNIFGSLFVFYASFTLLQDQGFVFSKKRVAIAFFLLVLMLFLVLTKFSLYNIVNVFFVNVPFLCILFWRDSALLRFYQYFRKFVIFYAYVSIFAEILVLTHLWTHVPHIILPPHDLVQENAGTVNYFYGFFCIPAEDTSLSFYRACGPLREGGHFVFFIGFVYFVERTLYRRIDIPLLFCGLLTLSPNFVAVFLITEGFLAIKEKKIVKPVLGIIGTLGIVFLLYTFSPQKIKDEITYVILERSLEASIEASESDGFIAILEGRTNMEGRSTYDNFLNSSSFDQMIGLRGIDYEDFVLSDYRWMFVYCGYLGTFLYIICTLLIACQKNHSVFAFCILLLAMLVFLQRVWMFLQPYIWTMMLLTTTVEGNLSKIVSHGKIIKK